MNASIDTTAVGPELLLTVPLIASELAAQTEHMTYRERLEFGAWAHRQAEACLEVAQRMMHPVAKDMTLALL